MSEPKEAMEVEAVETTVRDPYREGRGMERLVRWTRTITVTGTQDWIEATRVRALTDGVHIVGQRRDVPLTIEVETTNIETLRALQNPTSNQALTDLRLNHPDLYESIHGKGTATAHGDPSDRPSTPPPPAAQPRPNDADPKTHFGTYL